MSRALRVLCTSAGVATAATALSGLVPAPASAATVGERAVALAAQEAGHPYVYGAAGPNSFDCSGLVMFVYGRLGIRLPHNTTLQYRAMPHVPQSAAKLGDIVFFYNSRGTITHDGIYAGGGTMWAAPHTGDVVKHQAIYTSAYYVGRPSGSTAAAPAAPAPRTRPAPRAHPASAPRPAGATLQQGSRGPAVVTLQRQLHIQADGDFGPATAAAVRRFQSTHGLTADGVVGPQTRAALGRGSATAVPVSNPGVGTLQQGARGPAVAALQRALGITADGSFGAQTRAAVVAFQRSHHLTADGVVGPRTRAALSTLAA